MRAIIIISMMAILSMSAYAGWTNVTYTNNFDNNCGDGIGALSRQVRGTSGCNCDTNTLYCTSGDTWDYNATSIPLGFSINTSRYWRIDFWFWSTDTSASASTRVFTGFTGKSVREFGNLTYLIRNSTIGVYGMSVAGDVTTHGIGNGTLFDSFTTTGDPGTEAVWYNVSLEHNASNPNAIYWSWGNTKYCKTGLEQFTDGNFQNISYISGGADGRESFSNIQLKYDNMTIVYENWTADPVYPTTQYGNSTKWTWTYNPGTTFRVKSGTSTSWSWLTYTASSGRKIPNGTSTSWSWQNE